MPPVANYALDGVALTNPEHGWLLTADTQLDMPVSSSVEDITLPGTHGSVAGLPSRFESPVLELTHDIAADSQQELRARHQALVALLRQGRTLRRTEAGVEPVDARAELVSVSTPSRFVAGHSLAFTSQFRLPDVFWRSTDYTVDEWLFATLLDDIEVQGLRGSTAPITDAAIRVQGPLSSLVLVDNASKTSVRWGGNLPAEYQPGIPFYLYIDCATHRAIMRATPNGWDGRGSGPDVSGGLYTTGTGMLQLTPTMWQGDPTDRRVIFDANGSGRDGDSTKLAIRARRSYL